MYIYIYKHIHINIYIYHYRTEKNFDKSNDDGKSNSNVDIEYYDNDKSGNGYKKFDIKNNKKKDKFADYNDIIDSSNNDNADQNKNSRYYAKNISIKNNEKNSIKSEIHDNSDLGSTNAVETTVIMLDHINDSKRYFDFLKKFTLKLNLKCSIFYDKNFDKRMKNIIIIIQSYNSNKDFITLLKTEYVDVNIKKQPCKERCSTTIFNSKIYCFIENNDNDQHLGTFLLIDCDTKETIKLFREKYDMPEIGDSINNFCFKNR
jgi:hypothetical protein